MDLTYIYIYICSIVIIQIFGAAVYIPTVGMVTNVPTLGTCTSYHLIAELLCNSDDEIKTRMRSVTHVACLEEVRNLYKSVVV
jgi:hypothetical protein